MNPRRFDSLTRSLAAPKTRRDLLGGLAVLAAALGSRTAAQAACPPGQTPNRKGDCSCPPGTDACLDGCFDRKRNPNNCGGCGRSCAGGECRKGGCRCPGGQAPTAEHGCLPPPVCTVTDATCVSGVDVCLRANCYCFPSTEGTPFCGEAVPTCGQHGYCGSSADCDVNERCALNTCCGRDLGSECCPSTGGICVLTCDASALPPAPALGPDTSPPTMPVK